MYKQDLLNLLGITDEDEKELEMRLRGHLFNNVIYPIISNPNITGKIDEKIFRLVELIYKVINTDNPTELFRERNFVKELLMRFRGAYEVIVEVNKYKKQAFMEICNEEIGNVEISELCKRFSEIFVGQNLHSTLAWQEATFKIVKEFNQVSGINIDPGEVCSALRFIYDVASSLFHGKERPIEDLSQLQFLFEHIVDNSVFMLYIYLIVKRNVPIRK